MKSYIRILLVLIFLTGRASAQTNISPDKIKFVRQGVKRLIFDEKQNIPLAQLDPSELIGITTMHPTVYYSDYHADIRVKNNLLMVQSLEESDASIWFGGFNPFAVYIIDIDSVYGQGEIGFEFSDNTKTEQFFITISYSNNEILDVKQKYIKESRTVVDESILLDSEEPGSIKGKIILQMLGSGFTLFRRNYNLPVPIAQSDFAQIIDFREKKYMQSFQSNLYFSIKKGGFDLNKILSALNPGVGLSDIRAITYEDGEPFLDMGRLWYTMSIRGRALPQQLQGVFSLNPTVFDLRFEGVILFDRNDGLLRNEIASHIFYDRNINRWRGMTTGFSSYAKPNEKKQLLAVESIKDPRFGFSIMTASEFGIVGDIEDPHILYDSEVQKWRILTCKNNGGYKAIMLESEEWNKNYHQISGPVEHNSTGTSIQRIGNMRYCFSGSQDRKIYIYSYPKLKEIGILNIDLPPWDETSGTRIWPNVVQLQEGNDFRFIALMMDRYNYPGLKGPNWSYGALYLYYGFK